MHEFTSAWNLNTLWKEDRIAFGIPVTVGPRNQWFLGVTSEYADCLVAPRTHIKSREFEESRRTHATLQWIREVTEELREFADYLATPRNTDSFPVGPRINDLDRSKHNVWKIYYLTNRNLILDWALLRYSIGPNSFWNFFVKHSQSLFFKVSISIIF